MGRTRTLIALLAAALAALLASPAAAAEPPLVHELAVEGPITPTVAEYVARALGEAAEARADVVLLRLDTPGGSVAALDDLVSAFLRSSVPVVVWVAPSGASAGSAGALVVLAGHQAAMAPGTVIGAASPVGGGGQELGETLREKTENFLAARARSLARNRGPAAQDWAEHAVRDAAAASAEEALDLGVVDLVTASRDELLERLDGRMAEVSGVPVRLRTRGARVEEIGMGLLERALHALTSPALLAILLLVGVSGLLFEFANPGAILPGAAGAICLALALYGMGALSVNWIGLALVLVGIVLLVLELHVTSFGLLTVGGLGALVGGLYVLLGQEHFADALPAIVAAALFTAGFVAFSARAVLRARRRQPTVGREGLVGRRGKARTALAPSGMVFVQGELWRARLAEGAAAPGDAVEVVAVEGLELEVRRVQP